MPLVCLPLGQDFAVLGRLLTADSRARGRPLPSTRGSATDRNREVASTGGPRSAGEAGTQPVELGVGPPLGRGNRHPGIEVVRSVVEVAEACPLR